jgi:tRNA pseudouridine55 synthase
VQDVAVDRERLEDVLQKFRGTFAQTPPAVSAKKIAGRPAYEMARKKQPVELKAVEIEVYTLEVLHLEGCEASVRVHCSAGTYLRSIAHDAGQALGCGAHLKSLRRTASGDFKIEAARTLEQLTALAADGRFDQAVIPAAELLPEFPAELVDALTAGQIRNGRDFRTSPFQTRADGRFVKAVTPEGQLVAIGEARLPHLYHPVLVL